MNIITNLQMYLGILIIVIIILSQAIKILREYERGVIFRLGRLAGAWTAPLQLDTFSKK